MSESDGEAVGCNNFDGGGFGIDKSDGHESRRGCCVGILLLPIFFEPGVEGVDRTTGLLGGSGNGELGVENEVNGLLFDFGGKVGAGHGDGKGRWCVDRTDAANYYDKTKSRNNAASGTLTIIIIKLGQ